MKVAIVTGLTTEGDMKIQTSHGKQIMRSYNSFGGVKVPFRKAFLMGCIVGLVVTFPVLSQKAGKILEVRMLDGLKRSKVQWFRYPDSLGIVQGVNQVFLGLHRQSYLLAHLDSLFWGKDSIRIWVSQGKAFKWVNLGQGNVSEEWLSASGYREKLYQNRRFSYRQVEHLEERLLQTAENQGYPFAMVWLDSVQVEIGRIWARLYLEPGYPFRFDTLSISGSARLSPRFLRRYLRIFPRDLFSQQKVDQSEDLLRQLPYLHVRESPELVFHNERVYLNLPLDSRKASQFNGVIGFLPNESGKGLQLTGEVNLQLHNLFQSGKRLDLFWQQVRPLSPVLDISYFQPVFLRGGLEAELRLYFLKQDSTFLNFNRQLSMRYRLGKLGKLGVVISNLTSAALGKLDTALVQLPGVLSTRLWAYGLEYLLDRTDDPQLPLNGWEMRCMATVGNKEVRPAVGLDPTLYERIKRRSPQFQLRAQARYYVSLRSRLVLMSRIQAGGLWNDNLFQNELFRLGGLNSLRGFNENTFFVSHYGVVSAELRYLLEKETFVFAFYDKGWLYGEQPNARDAPYGLGLGLRLKTQGGIFNFVYALGRSAQQPLGLNFSRIHFGYSSFF
jgi:translocation and assembly module TamA